MSEKCVCSADEVDPLEPNDEIDARFIKVVLNACLESVDEWLKDPDPAYPNRMGVQGTRRFVRKLVAGALRKKGEPVAKKFPGPGIGTSRITCLQCQINFYNCTKPPAQCQADYTKCVNGPPHCT